MKGDAIAATEALDCAVFGVCKMELHTDDEKVRASIAKDATPLSLLKMAPSSLSSGPDPPENGLEHGHDDSGLQPLSEEALQKSGVFSAADIPMIDDDEDDEGTPIDDVLPETPGEVSSSPESPPSPPGTDGGDTTKPAGEKQSGVSCNGVAPKAVKAEEDPTPSSTADSKPAEVTAAPPKPRQVSAPLKSALKKSRGKAKKGHRVTFHDSRIFYIDTEAETTAEPQLLTVRSLELPMASADYKIFIPNYDVLPMDGRSYTYEDAIVSLQRRGDDVETPAAACSLDSVASVAEVSKADESEAEVTQVLDSGNGTDAVDAAIAPEEPPAVAPLLETSLDDVQTAEAVQSLTEANLRQHEILMEQDDGVATEEPEPTPAPAVPSKAPVEVPAMPLVKNLSPPLKELSVDVSGTAAGWQVELSPLNSIPESETDDSSASSQDTIIMMTSEESRRNEEHIRESTMSYQQQSGKVGPASQQECLNGNNGDAASTDSDETLKCDESVDPGYVPPWTKGTAATLVVNGGGDHLTFSQRTNSQIRQLMERNAVRRSLLRYSNTRKRAPTTVTPPPEESPLAAIDRQRQWRSHESLLDTIKQLTVEEDEDDDGDYEEIRIHGEYDNGNGGYDNNNDNATVVTNGYRDHYRYANGSNSTNETNRINGTNRYSGFNGTNGLNGINGMMHDRTASSLSLIASPPLAATLQRHRSQSTTAVDVPGDVRQWKIQATRWDEARRQQQQVAPPPLPATQADDGNYTSDTSYTNDTSDTSDELAQFVQRDSGRIERLRKRYSYSDSGDYEAIGAFARRSSVRGIKPRFGSTTEILKQMQSQLQPSPLASGRGHMTWPYPVSGNEDHGNNVCNVSNNNNNNRHTMTIRTTVTSRSTNSLPSLKEEIYGIVGAHRASYAGSNPNAIYAPLPGRNHAAPPPPYQPPPPVPVAPPKYPQQQRAYSKDERGVPEGASGSPKAAGDSIYGRTTYVQPQHRVNGAPPAPPVAGNRQMPTVTDNSGVVYYVMQV